MVESAKFIGMSWIRAQKIEEHSENCDNETIVQLLRLPARHSEAM